MNEVVVFDTEGVGLARDATKIHVLSYTTDGTNVHSLTDYDEIRALLTEKDERVWVCHNIWGHDIPALETVLGVKPKGKFIDTLILSRYLDFDRQKHGLESYGETFGVKKPEIEDWEGLTTEEYVHRCVEDVKINWKLWKHLTKKLSRIYDNVNDLKKVVYYLSFKAECAAEQEQVGWRIDVEAAKKLQEVLSTARNEKVEELRPVMPQVAKMKKVNKPKEIYKKDGSLSVAGVRWKGHLHANNLPANHEGPVSVIDRYEEANPGSSDQVKAWLYSLGWEPLTYKYVRDKKTGDERKIEQVRKDGELCPSVTALIEEEPAVTVLEGLTVINHRLGVVEGLLECQQGGWVKAGFNGLTNTLRFKHAKPVVNLPGVNKPWGEEIRSLFLPPDEDHLLCGSDMVSLESTTKRHYMYPYDPEYVDEMSQQGFDEHLDLAEKAGAVTKQQVADHIAGIVDISSIRKSYKVTNYSAIYGVGPPKLARELKTTEAKAKQLLEAYWSRNWAVKELVKDLDIKKVDGQLWLRNPVSGFWHSLRYKKDAFSTLNQSTGAFCFDAWVYFCRKRGVRVCGQFHDEQANPVHKDDKEKHREILFWAIDRANEKLKLNVRLAIDVKFGENYAQIH